MKKYQTVSVSDIQTMLQDENTMFLDCRELKDYQVAHIENAMHVHQGLRDALLKKGDKNKKMVIYCYYGHASEHLAEMFADFGFKRVYSLEGCFAAWREGQVKQDNRLLE